MKAKKIILRGISIALACTACFLTACASCQSNNSSSGGDVGASIGYIVKDGVSEYTILMPEELDDNLKVAVADLQYGIEETCGYKMPTTTVYDENKKYLSVGKTALYEENKEQLVGDGLGADELRVLTVGDDVIMVGETNRATCYAVYDFMETTFDFKWYTYEDAYIKKASEIKLLSLDRNDEPELLIRDMFQGPYWQKDLSTYKRFERNRRMRFSYVMEDLYFSHGHNMLGEEGAVLSKLSYVEEHPEWFSRPDMATDFNGVGQLCLTNEEMTEEFIRRVKEIIVEKWNDERSIFFIGMGDNEYYCECENCNTLLAETGSQAGNFIVFANKVVRAINDEWIEMVHPGHKITFGMFAYLHNLYPPVRKVGGKYVPTCDKVIMDKNLYVSYAPLLNDFTYSWNDPRNTVISDMLDQWGAVAGSNIVARGYNINCVGYGWLPFNDLLTMGGNYQMVAERGYVGYIEEGGTLYEYPCMQKLKNYISSQLWWDANSGSVDELAYEFINFYYAPVAEEFKVYYRALKQFQIYQVEKLNLRVMIMSGSYANAEYWPYDFIMEFDEMVEGMLKKIENLKSVDMELYQKYFDRINVEKVWLNFALCNYYKQYFSDSEFKNRVTHVSVYAREYNILNQEWWDKVDALLA